MRGNSGYPPGLPVVRGIPRDVEYDAYENLPPRVRERVKYAQVKISCFALAQSAENEANMLELIDEAEEQVRQAVNPLLISPSASCPARGPWNQP